MKLLLTCLALLVASSPVRAAAPPALPAKVKAAEEPNLYAARVYAADPEKYPGIFQIYAKMIFQKQEGRPNLDRLK